jgi:hypothetical protein
MCAEAPREPAHPRLRGSWRMGRERVAPRIAVVTFPGSNDDGDAVLALERLGARPSPSGTRRQRSTPTSAASSFPEASRTATTSAAAHSPGWQP